MRKYNILVIAFLLIPILGNATLEDLQDPMLENEFNTQNIIQLQGIGSTKEDDYCIINNQILKLGDSVKGYVVVDINPEYIILEKNKEQKSIYIDSEEPYINI